MNGARRKIMAIALLGALWGPVLGFMSASGAWAHILDIYFHAQGETQTTMLGISLAGIGDINHDGCADIALTSLGKGATFVYYGGNSRDSVPDLRLPQMYARILSAREINHGLWDVNRDGNPDLVGSTGAHILIFHGNALTLDTIAADTVQPDAPAADQGDVFGVDMACADFDGDSLSDFVVVYQRLDQSISFYSGALGYDTPAWILRRINNYTTYRSCCAVDLDGDGRPEVVVGVDGYSPDSIPGRLLVFDTSPLDSIPEFQFFCPPVTYPENKWDFGFLVRNVGDFNGDGFDDVGAPAGGDGFIFFGGPGIWDSVPDLRFNSTAGNLEAAGDVNADGVDDIIVGNTGFLFETGRAELFLGGNPPDPNMDYWMDYRDLPPHDLQWFGYRLAPAGDFNGDGADDVIVGADNFLDWYWGDVFVFGIYQVTSGIEDSVADPADRAVNQSVALTVSPIPFNSALTIQADIFRSCTLRLQVFDVLGRAVATLARQVVAPGRHTFRWDGRGDWGGNLASGVYFVVATADESRITRRVILIK